MAIDVTSEIVIARPRIEVYAFAADPTNAPRWYAAIERVAWQGEPMLREGARVDFVARFLGRRLSYTCEIVEMVVAERLVMRAEQAPFPMETVYGWADAGADATRMTLSNRGGPDGAGRLLAPLLAAAVRRANRKDLARLKRALESG